MELELVYSPGSSRKKYVVMIILHLVWRTESTESETMPEIYYRT